MKNDVDKQIDEILKNIEFPGEENQKLHEFSADRDFVNKVMKAIEAENKRIKMLVFWFLFILIHILILLFLGTNKFIQNEYFAFSDTLQTIFYLFLGISLSGGIIGLIVQLDTSRVHDMSHIPAAISERFEKVKKRLLGR